MSEQPLLTVRGEIVREVEPETARIELTITAKDTDRATTLRLLGERANVIDAILSRFGNAIEKIETNRVRVGPQFRNGRPRERISGYVGVAQHHITVADFDRLGELVAQLADQDLTTVSGPWWDLRRDSPAHRDARIEAVKEAVQRARDYAEALGSRLIALVELADAQLLSDGGGSVGPFAAASASRRMAPHRATEPDELTFDITPAKQTVWATIEARFLITAPELDALERPDAT